jgi:transposase
VPVKSTEQQGVMVLHRTRLVMTRQRTQLSNAIRGHMAEFGLTAAIGREGLGKLIAVILDGDDDRVTKEARVCLAMLVDQLRLAASCGVPSRNRARSASAARRWALGQ